VATAGAEAVTVGAASAVAVSMEEVSAAVVSTVVVVSMGEVSLVTVSTAEASAVAVSTAVAFVGAVSTITDSLMMCSSAASAFPAGGAGTIRTDITVTAITRTVTMDTVGIHTATKVTGATVITVARL